MANPAPTINQINAFNATQGTTIDFNIIGGTELVRSNRIYIYDLSDNSLICTHLYVSTESIHELPANTDGSILYADGKSSADFVNGAQYYAQIQTFTDIAGTEGGSGLSVAKMFWCLVDPTLTIDAIPSTISTTSYNVSATYNANTSVVSNIIQQYQFNLYNATGSLLQSSGVIVGSGEQQGTSTAYDISYNFTGLSVGSSYYVTVEVTTTQGMSINTQSNTFTVSIDTPTLGEATVVNNACDGYISVTSNLSGEYGGSGSGEIVSFETDSENVFTKLQVDLEPVQEGTPWVSASETEPYLMRISPQLGHDYNTEFDTLVGGTVAWNQLVQNLGLSQWYSTNSTKNFANDILTLSVTQTPTSWYATRGYIYITLVQGHKCIAFANVKPSISATARIYCGTTVRNIDQATTANSYTQIHSMFTVSSANDSLNISTGSDFANWAANDTLMIKDVQIFDLTQMFGSTIADYIYSLETANAGAGVAFFRKYFPKAYYAYDAGTLMSVKTSAHKTTGKNLLRYPYENTTKTSSGITFTDNGDGSITANGTATATAYFDVIASSNPMNIESGVYTYSVHGVGARLYLYVYQNGRWGGIGDATDGHPRSFTAQSNTTVYGFFAVNSGVTVNNQKFYLQLEKGASATAYEPYVEHVYPLDPNLELRGIPKLVDNKLQYDGDVYSSSGNVQRKYGIVDLGTLNWAYNASWGGYPAFYVTTAPDNILPIYVTSKYPQNYICQGYEGYTRDYLNAHDVTGFCIPPDGKISIRDSRYTDAAAFKTAMSGVYLVYELATPTTESAMPFEANQSIVPNGSEEYVDNRTVPIPVGHLTSYADVYPITGHDEVDVEHTGKNLIKVSNKSYDNSQNCTYEITDSGVTVTATGQYARRMDTYKVVVGQTYTVSFKAKSTGNNNNVYFCKAGGVDNWNTRYGTKVVTSTEASYAYTFTAETDVFALGWYVTSNSSTGVMTITDLQLEYGSTATAYEPYTAESFHQDIEATYTPTVQKNEAYLFKQTGDVGGDRETIELVGGTVAWNQLAGGTWRDGYTKEGVTYTPNNDGTFTLNGTATATDWWSVTPYPNVNTSVIGHKYFVCDANMNGTSSYGISFGGIQFVNVGIANANNANSSVAYWYNNGAVINNVTFKPMCFDLTAMFDSTIADYIYSLEQANAGDGVAFFRKLFPKAYYPYNAGELISVKASSHNTVGKNFSEESFGYANMFNRYIPKGTVVTASCVTPSGGNAQINYYREDRTRIDYWTLYTDLGNGRRQATFTLLEDAYYWAWTGYQTEKYQLEIGSNATSYEPYDGNTYPLDSDLELRGILKLDISNKLYYDGDTYKHDGSVNRRFGIVDMGTLYWSTLNDSFVSDISNKAIGIGDLMCKYPNYTATVALADMPDKMIKGSSTSNNIYIKDSSYTTAQAFKTAMSGVYLVYPLATPTTETADAFEEIQKVTPIYGTEEFVDNRAVPMPVYTKTQYFTRDIYGGYIDLVSGLLVLTHGIATYDGTESWYAGNSNQGFYRNANDMIKASDYKDKIVCNRLQSYNFQSKNEYLNADSGITGYYDVNSAYPMQNWIYAKVPNVASVTDFRTWLSNNPLQVVYELATPQTYQLTPQQIQTFVGKNNVWSEQGDVEVAYHIPITNLLVKRQDVDDVSGSWLTLHSQPITQSSDMDFTFIDFTNQYGKTYKYALVPLLTQTQSGVEVEVEGGYTVSDEVQSIFDGVFIVDSTGSQKCKANVGYGNVDMNQTVGTITPIGAKYPVVITNSKNQYHNGSISGTIVPDDYYFNGNLSRIDMVNKRDELEQFLTNKRAKIIKDWNGKIWLVMIMDNVSCTFNNNYGMGIVNFSTNWIEVGDPTNQQDLQATGLIDVGGA